MAVPPPWEAREICFSLLQKKTHRMATLLQLHAFMLRRALESNLHLVSMLITHLTAADGQRGTRHARQLFDKMPRRPDVPLCTAMMKSHHDSGQFSEAIHLYVRLQREIGFVPDNYTFSILTKCCSSSFLTWEGMEVHAHVVRYGFSSDLYVMNALSNMYGKMRQMDFARKVFDEMTERSSGSWTVLLYGYIRNGDMGAAQEVFDLMHENEKDAASFTKMIDGYVKLGDMRSAKMLFDVMPEKNEVAWCTMINGYVKLEEMRSAKMLFDAMPEKNVVSWNTLIGGYVKLGDIKSARILFDAMPEKDAVSWTSMINGYVKSRDMGFAKILFDAMPEKCVMALNTLMRGYIESGDIGSAKMLFDMMPEKDVWSWNTLINGYAKLRDMQSAKMLFDTMPKKSVVSWNTLINGYAKLRDMQSAKMLFDAMPEKDVVSWNMLIDGYVKSGDMRSAKMMFDAIPEKDVVSWNILIDGYVKSGDMRSAKMMFDAMPERNVGSWTVRIKGYSGIGDSDNARLLFDKMPNRNLRSFSAMMHGYCNKKQSHEALLLFQQFLAFKTFEPDKIIVLMVLPAIADLGALDLGNRVYDFVKKKKFDIDAEVSTAVVDMYAKCEEIEKSRKVFHESRARDARAWTAFINGLALNGCFKEALEVFADMERNGFYPNDSTFEGVLSACSHGGLVEEGIRWFIKIRELGLTPGIKHYGCMIDLLVKAGCLEEAEMLIERMPYQADEIMLTSFFACVNANDVTRAEEVVRKALTRKGVAKNEVCYSSVEINGQILKLVAGDKTQPLSQVTQLVLDQLQMHMKLQDPQFLLTM